ncbi:MAG: hypothetical protein ACFB22_04760 [Rhodothalassiaceae bacterium]
MRLNLPPLYLTAGAVLVLLGLGLGGLSVLLTPGLPRPSGADEAAIAALMLPPAAQAVQAELTPLALSRALLSSGMFGREAAEAADAARAARAAAAAAAAQQSQQKPKRPPLPNILGVAVKDGVQPWLYVKGGGGAILAAQAGEQLPGGWQVARITLNEVELRWAKEAPVILPVFAYQPDKRG